MRSPRTSLVLLAALAAACGTDAPPPAAEAPAAPVAAAPSGQGSGEAVPAASTATPSLLSEPGPAPDPRGSLDRPAPPPKPALTPEEEYGRRMAAQREFRRYIDSVRAEMEKGRDRSVKLGGSTAALLGTTPEGGALGVEAEGPGRWSGLVGGPAEPATAVWEDAAAFRKGWSALTEEPVPAVDFAVARAAAVFLGRRPSGGYRVRLVSAEPEGASLAVVWSEELPRTAPPGETSPFLIFLLPRAPEPVAFRRADGPKKK